jgi:hypothetical protein
MAKPPRDGRQRCSLRAAVARHVEMELTPEQVAAFDERGLCFVHSVFAASEIAGLRQLFALSPPVLGQSPRARQPTTPWDRAREMADSPRSLLAFCTTCTRTSSHAWQCGAAVEWLGPAWL